jgi:hypothetical protein
MIAPRVEIVLGVVEPVESHLADGLGRLRLEGTLDGQHAA